MMKEIQLTQGKVTRVSDRIYGSLSRYKWHAVNVYPGLWYAARTHKGRKIYMHKQILGIDEDVDHIDGDGLNNLDSNLRSAIGSQNSYNRRKVSNSTSSRFKGVAWHKRDKKWFAYITSNGITEYLGYFVVEEDAARAYDRAARRLFGEYANTNF